MKTAMIARFVMGAAAIFAVGCGAEQGTEPDAIGSTSAALSVAAGDDLPSSTPPEARTDSAASCVIYKDTTPLLLFTGGFDPDTTGAAKSDLWLYDPAAHTWTHSSATLSTARGRHQGIVFPGDTHSCLFAGGATTRAGTTSVQTAEKVSIANNGTVTVSPAGTMAVARDRFKLLPCSTDKAIAIAGRTGSTRLDTVEVFDGSTTWTQYTGAGQKLGIARGDIAAAPSDTSNLKFFVSGGDESGGASKYVDLVVMASGCGTPAVTSNSDGLKQTSGTHLNWPTRGAVAFHRGVNGSNEIFLTAAGDNGGALNRSVEVEVDWSTTPPSIASVATGATLGTATIFPVLVKSGSTYLVSGGLDTFDPTLTDTAIDTIGAVQEYSPASSGSWSSQALAKDRAFHVAESISGTVYVASGAKITHHTPALTISWTDGLEGEAITP